MKPVIAMPNWRSIENLAAISLLKVVQSKGFDIIFQRQDSLVARARARLVSRFLGEYDSDVMIFIDDDIVFEPLDVNELVSECRRLKAVVGAPVSLREEGEVNVKPFPGQTIVFHPDEEFVGQAPSVKVEAIGTTMMAIHRDVLLAVNATMESTRELPDEEPFWPIFEAITHPDYLAEDFSFCKLARDAGFDIWCLPSLNIGHIGTKEYRIEEGQMERRENLTASTTNQKWGEA